MGDTDPRDALISLKSHVDYLIEVRDKARELLVAIDSEFPYVHLGSSLASLDILNVLVRIIRRAGDCRDWLILSIGHVAPALYSILAVEGVIPKDWLFSINEVNSKVSTHMDDLELPLVDVTTGSLGQGLSVGVGLALSLRLSGCRRGRVFILMGDGELNEGQNWEAAATAVNFNLNNLIAIVSLNNYQLDGPTDSIKRVNYIDVFRAFGWRVIVGDGHDYLDIINKLADALEGGGPVVVFYRTTRGKGVRYIEGSGRQSLRTIPRPVYSMREALGVSLARLGEDIEELVVLTADVGESTRSRYFGERFPSRFFNVGISEQDLVDVAAGLALGGYLPVAVAFSMFMMRAWEQIRNTIGRSRLNVKLIGTHAGLSDFADGPSHQALEDVALMRSIDGMTVVAPADAWEVERALPEIISHRGPVYVRIGRDYSPPITIDMEYKFQLGRGLTLLDGDDLAIVGYGPVLYHALEAARELNKMGYSVGVHNIHTIKPIDVDLLRRIAQRTGAIITVEEHSPYGGLGSAVAEVISGLANVKIMGVRSTGHWGRSEVDLIRYFGLNEESIISEALRMIKERG